MRRLNSTVVVLAGERLDELLTGLNALHNVRAVPAGERDAAEMTGLAARASATYFVHDADPLADVREAWIGFFDGEAPVGRLEVAIEAAARALRAESVQLPDYYVVLDPESLSPTARHWWLGVLAGVAPARVVPVARSVAAVRDALAHLTAGRWWPADLTQWLRGLPRVVPDRAGMAAGGR